jgi:ethanolaminephosphotransferase
MDPLTFEEKKLVRQFTYKGGDASYIYAFALSPLAQNCVDYFIPLWMAPNIITLLGLFATITSLALTLIFNPDLGPNGPTWLHFLSGINIFLYQTLDNMDGKQARRTGSSSALGMVFDHGCDSLNASLSAPVIASVLGLGWTVPGIFFCLLSGFVPFYIATWESYYTDRMDIPVINGPTEGLLIASSMCFLSFVHGPAWWHQTSVQVPVTYFPSLNTLGDGVDYFLPMLRVNPGVYSLSYYNLVCLSSIVITLITITSQAIGVFAIVKDNASSTGDRRKKSIGQALVNLLPFFILFPTGMYYCSASSIAFPTYPMVTMTLMGSAFLEMTVHIMICQICARHIKPFHRIAAWGMLLLPFTVYLSTSTSSTSIETAYLFSLTVLSVVFTAVTMTQVCGGLCSALDIYIFTLGKRKIHSHSRSQ